MDETVSAVDWELRVADEYLKGESIQILVETKSSFSYKLYLLGLKEKTNVRNKPANLQRHVELKYPSSVGKYLPVNDDHKKPLTKGEIMSQLFWLLSLSVIS